MNAVVVDIDDTIVSTDRRRHAAWCKVLRREIPFQSVESSSSEEILRKYVASDRKIWKRFWMLILCVDESGIDLLELPESLHTTTCRLLTCSSRARNKRNLN